MTKIDEVINLWLEDMNAYGNELSLAIKKAIAEVLNEFTKKKKKSTKEWEIINQENTLFLEEVDLFVEQLKKELCGEETKGK